MGEAEALAVTRAGIESQKARGPRDMVIVGKPAAINCVCGRVVMYGRREPFGYIVWFVIMRRARSTSSSSGGIRTGGRHESARVRRCRVRG